MNINILVGWRPIAQLAVATWLLSINVATAQLSIGVKFVGGVHTTGPDASFVTGVAGVIGQSNWNNVAPWSATMNRGGGALPDADGLALNLISSAGDATTADVSWVADNSYASLSTGIFNQHAALMDGYIDVSGAKPRTTVQFTQIPFSTYDVYVYVGSDGNDRTAYVDINNDPLTQTWFITNTGGGRFTGAADYRRATAKNEATAQPGNYILFPKVQGSTLDLAVNQGSFNAGIHGIQLVQSILPSKIVIDTTTGRATIVGGDVIPVDINGYELSSSVGSLRPELLQGFQTRLLDPVDGSADADLIPGNSTGETWQVVSAGADTIVEGFLFGSSTFTTSRQESLGNIYNPAFGQDSSLVFRYTLKSGVTVDGSVEFVSSPPLPGDYNRNGVVDAADYTVWRDSLGQTGSGLPADGSGNSSIGPEDYAIWVGQFGASSAASGSTSVTGSVVPEPSAAVLACLLITLCAKRRAQQVVSISLGNCHIHDRANLFESSR